MFLLDTAVISELNKGDPEFADTPAAWLENLTRRGGRLSARLNHDPTNRPFI